MRQASEATGGSAAGDDDGSKFKGIGITRGHRHFPVLAEALVAPCQQNSTSGGMHILPISAAACTLPDTLGYARELFEYIFSAVLPGRA